MHVMVKWHTVAKTGRECKHLLLTHVLSRAHMCPHRDGLNKRNITLTQNMHCSHPPFCCPSIPLPFRVQCVCRGLPLLLTPSLLLHFNALQGAMCMPWLACAAHTPSLCCPHSAKPRDMQHELQWLSCDALRSHPLFAAPHIASGCAM